jgi:hypothetical protein
MKKRIPPTAKGKPVTKRRRIIARRFSPPEPVIVAGKFKGQKLSELSNEELMYFLRCDAGSQRVFEKSHGAIRLSMRRVAAMSMNASAVCTRYS